MTPLRGEPINRLLSVNACAQLRVTSVCSCSNPRVLLNERKAKTAVRIRRVLVEDGREPGSTLVSSVKGKEDKDSGSNPPIAGGGWQRTGFDSG